MHLERSDAYGKNITATAKIGNFWRRPVVGNDEFLKNVKTGDIILFKNKGNFVATMQRVFSNSDYGTPKQIFSSF